MKIKRVLHPGYRIDIVTLFPGMFKGPLSESLVGRAARSGILQINIHDLRDWAEGVHRVCDDRPYGGGAGMVIKPEPVWRVLKSLGAFSRRAKRPHVIYLSPQGEKLNQRLVRNLSENPWIVLLCGHYEGIDNRVLDWVDQEISVGDYVLTGGEIPAMVVADAVSRYVPGVVKESSSVENDSFSERFLDYPHYTRPQVFRRKKVPSVLLSGDHQAIEEWRKGQALLVTRQKRPDLLKGTTRLV